MTIKLITNLLCTLSSMYYDTYIHDIDYTSFKKKKIKKASLHFTFTCTITHKQTIGSPFGIPNRMMDPSWLYSMQAPSWSYSKLRLSAWWALHYHTAVIGFTCMEPFKGCSLEFSYRSKSIRVVTSPKVSCSDDHLCKHFQLKNIWLN